MGLCPEMILGDRVDLCSEFCLKELHCVLVQRQFVLALSEAGFFSPQGPEIITCGYRTGIELMLQKGKT